MISFERPSRCECFSFSNRGSRKKLNLSALSTQLVLAVFSIPFLLPSSAAMSDMQTIRTEENGVVHHRLESCGYERGVAIAHYTHRPDQPRPHTTHEFELTDMCFQRETGRLWASEPAENFTLVQQDPSISWYEDLATEIGRSGFKGKISAGGYAQVPGKPDVRASYVDLFFDPTRPNVTRPTTFHQHTADSANLMGYLFEKQASPDEATGKPYRIILSGFDWGLSDPASSNAGYGRKNSDLGLHSDSLVFDQNGGALGTGSFFQSNGGDANGQLIFGQLHLALDPDGTVSGRGEFHIKTTRLAGLEPGDWVSASWRIDKLIGHLAGESATGFRLVGVASGETRYHDGYVGQIIGTVSVRGTDLAFENEFLAGGQ